VVAWSVPAVSTTVALVLHKLDADELSGLCEVGAAGVVNSALVEFVVVPTLACLAAGVAFAAAGFAAVCAKRSSCYLANNSRHSNNNLIIIIIIATTMFMVLSS